MRKVFLFDGKIKVLFQGLAKGRITDFVLEEPLFATVDTLKVEESNEESIKSVIEVLIENVKKLLEYFENAKEISKFYSKEHVYKMWKEFYTEIAKKKKKEKKKRKKSE